MDNEVFELIKQEETRQRETITLIPSENYASKAVRSAQGSMLGNKYSEGYPGKRYYQGNGIIDQIEQLAIDRAKKLFNVPWLNVQPYSGSPMNLEVLLALLKPGDKITGMEMASGGHLTHGSSVSFTGKLFKPAQFGTDADGRIDYDDVDRLVKAEKPKLMLIGTTAYSRIFDWKKLREIADTVGAYLVTDISHIAGLVVGGVHPSPVPFADVVTSTTHKSLRGPRGGMIMVTNRGLARDRKLADKIDKAVFPGMQGGPHENTIAALAIALDEAGKPEFKEYAAQIVKNAQVLVEELQRGGIKIVTGGTDNHLMLVDLRPLGLSGKQTAVNLEASNIVVNCNTIPHDTTSPMDPSGLRLGTPAVTTRGMKEPEMKEIAGYTIENIKAGESKSIREEIGNQIRVLCSKFPIPD